MELIRKGKDVLTMKYPASSKGSLWREGLASGNGTIGVNMYGGTKQETAVINHAELWSGHSSSSLPDVSGIIYEIRTKTVLQFWADSINKILIFCAE